MKLITRVALFSALLVFAACGKKSDDGPAADVDSLVSADTVQAELASDEYVVGEFTLPVKIVPGSAPGHTLEVRFLSKPIIKGEASEGIEMDVSKLTFYETGKIKSGKYTGERLFKIEKTYSDKVGDHYEVLRCTRQGETVVYLVGVSSPYAYVGWVDKKAGVVKFSFEGKDNTLMNMEPFKGATSVIIDSAATVKGLEAPKWIEIPKIPISLRLQREINATVDPLLLEVAFEHEQLGNVYTTKPHLNKRNFYHIDPKTLNFSAVGSCRGQDCLKKNGLYIFRQDQSALVYAFDLNTLDVKMEAANGFEFKGYEGSTFRDCGGFRMDYASVVPDDAINVETDLEAVGSSFSGLPVYTLVNPEHKALKGLYEIVKKSWDEYDQFGADLGPLPTYREYLVSVPMFFWKDPLGRLIRFLNDRYLPPTACEPIVYVYADTPTPVTLSIGDKVHVIKSIPEIGDGWKIRAERDGKLVDLGHGKRHDRLFWEGVSDYLPRLKSGFVVPQKQVKACLEETLKRQGLNRKEITEFLEAWLPDFEGAPFFRISFYDRAVIDRYAPLKADPQPDVVIRVLMDFEPLVKWTSIPEPEFQTPPDRSGLTVVEWGGLKR